MNKWTTILDFVLVYWALSSAVAYVFYRFCLPKSCQTKIKNTPDVVLGPNLAKGLLQIQKKRQLKI